MDVNPRSLVLNLLLATDGGLLGTAEAIKAGQLFEIGAGNVRVTLTRLQSAGLIEAASRGVYRLSSKGRVLASAVAAWRDVEERTCTQWDGSWVAVLTTDLPKADRTAWRARSRALAMFGLRELDAELYVRPNNLNGGVSQLRAQLLSMEEGAGIGVFALSELDPERDRRARGLWDIAALHERYRSDIKRLGRSTKAVTSMPLEVAAREAYVLGNEAIKGLVFDPLLPEPLIDVSTRKELVESVIRYEQIGRIIWRNFLKQQ